MTYWLITTSLAILLVVTPLSGEIQQVSIHWRSGLYQGTCVQLVEKELNKINGVDQLTIDQVAGVATLSWNPKIPFQYTAINTAMRMVGLSMRDIRICVRGLIAHTEEAMFIVSDGDGTRFELIHPLGSDAQDIATKYNYQARKLQPALKQKLLNGEKNRQIATVEGPVFMAERNTLPTQIVVDQLNFALPIKK